MGDEGDSSASWRRIAALTARALPTQSPPIVPD